jgi:hypothetical protein
MIGTIILFIISFVLGMWCMIKIDSILLCFLILIAPFVYIGINNYSNNMVEVDIGYNYTTNCYTAIGGFWNPYLRVDCNSTKVDLTKNETSGTYYINKKDGRQCLLLNDCLNTK